MSVSDGSSKVGKVRLCKWAEDDQEVGLEPFHTPIYGLTEYLCNQKARALVSSLNKDLLLTNPCSHGIEMNTDSRSSRE